MLLVGAGIRSRLAITKGKDAEVKYAMNKYAYREIKKEKSGQRWRSLQS
jgi:hypothetical protein